MTEKKKSARKRPSKASTSTKVVSTGGKPKASEASSSPAPAAPKADLLEGNIYTTGTWKGLPNYECLFCPFATVDHVAALEHFAAAHAPPEQEEQTINTGLVDSGGKPITRVETPAKEE
jgi:hypothetical protein